jgi:hypothetical protein
MSQRGDLSHGHTAPPVHFPPVLSSRRCQHLALKRLARHDAVEAPMTGGTLPCQLLTSLGEAL